MALLNQFVVLSDDATDDTPLLSTSDGGVSEVAQSTDNTVCADNSLLRFDDDWFFVPNEWFLKNFEDLLVDDRGLDTGDAPLVLGDEQRRNRVLNTHQQVVELFKSLEVKSALCPSEGVDSD